MCKENCDCTKGRYLKAHLSRNEVKRAELDGVSYIVVPVIMARGDVVMNSTLAPASEFENFAWNGVPVTLRHPQTEAGAFMSANTPEAIAKFAIGRIFNSEVRDGTLRAEAWIDVAKAEALMPGLSTRLMEGGPMDVSTGFFSDLRPAKGSINGRDYEAVHANIRPDHLALLPDQTGACSWEDGCGVRANKKGLHVKVQKAWAVIAEALGLPALVANSNEDGEDEGQGTQAAAEDDKRDPAMTKEEIAAMVAAAVKDAVNVAVTAALQAHSAKPALSAEDAAAIAHARQIAANHKAGLVAKIVANTTMTKEQAEALDVSALELFVNSLKPAAPAAADFSGRAFPAPIVNGNEAELAAAVTPKGILAHFAQKKAA